MISCRVRAGEPKIRCFRCFAYGHTAKVCDGPDRSSCCRRCGIDGHKVINCEASRDEAVSFRRSLNGVDGVTPEEDKVSNHNG